METSAPYLMSLITAFPMRGYQFLPASLSLFLWTISSSLEESEILSHIIKQYFHPSYSYSLNRTCILGAVNVPRTQPVYQMSEGLGEVTGVAGLEERG